METLWLPTFQFHRRYDNINLVAEGDWVSSQTVKNVILTTTPPIVLNGPAISDSELLSFREWPVLVSPTSLQEIYVSTLCKLLLPFLNQRYGFCCATVLSNIAFFSPRIFTKIFVCNSRANGPSLLLLSWHMLEQLWTLRAGHMLACRDLLFKICFLFED